MGKAWSYKNFTVEEGLKPGSKRFQYFFVLSKTGKKVCNYCVWIEDEAMPRFDGSTDFDGIVGSHREDWSRWVREKIDQEDFRNMVLLFDDQGQKEIELDKMDRKLSMD
jgi:hypothetical protein